jgi:hypothetical protein
MMVVVGAAVAIYRRLTIALQLGDHIGATIPDP